MTPLDELRDKVTLFRRLAAEQGFRVVIDDPLPLEPIPDGPPGAVDVFGLFSRVEGSFLRFQCPPEITSASTASSSRSRRTVDASAPASRNAARCSRVSP